MYGATRTPLLALKTFYSPLATERSFLVLICVQNTLPGERRLLQIVCLYRPHRNGVNGLFHNDKVFWRDKFDLHDSNLHFQFIARYEAFVELR